ncbi:MAG: T9SS type A sorting domain-containing protein [Bacteroidales bacterium]|nr:T9SS type A sorting domain-containing protein [Bacteroidales bacterium]
MGRYLDSIYTCAEILNVSQITDSNFNLYAYLYGVSNGEAYCIDSVKWIRHNNPYRYFEYKQYPARGFESYDCSPIVTYSYEFYFDKPISVAGTFFIGVRFPYVNDFAQLYTRWGTTEFSSGNDQWEYHNKSDRPAREMYFCNHHVRVSNKRWGGFFPILTPRDTTRCDPPADLRMIHATDTSVMLEWYGGNATQWEVEYAEADGMTAYTVTTNNNRVTLTGLRPTTTYLAHVRAWCTRDSEYGEWSPSIEARTTAHQPDTDTVQGPDTVSIDAVGFFTRLMPNPASGIVTVQSTYRLSHVAVYDVQGHLVLEQKAAGNAATFDVGRLPKGVYVASVRTAAGTTTKRLVVE